MEGELVPVPLGVKSENDAVGARLVETCSFPLEAQVKTSLHGLPLRLKWQLLAVVLGWRTDAAALKRAANGKAVGELVACLDLGKNGHYFHLDTPAGAAEEQTFGGEDGAWPQCVMTAYHQRSGKLRVSLVRAEDRAVTLAYCRLALKDLVAGKPTVGWVKVKAEETDARTGQRPVVGTVRVGLLMSPSQRADALFLLDVRERMVAFFQERETLVDLNPAFDTPALTAFRWRRDKGGALSLSPGQNASKVLATVCRKTMADGSVCVDVVQQPEGGEYWQCTLTGPRPGADKTTSYCVDGAWSGTVVEAAKSLAVTVFTVESAGAMVARAEWRNARDVKLSVDPTVDPLVAISLILAVHPTAFAD